MTKFLDAALRYAELGYRVFPCVPNGKAPLTRHGFYDATTDPRRLERWWKKQPTANLGLATQRLIVIDIDGAGNTWPNDSECGAELSAAPLSLTPRGGSHRIFRQPAGKAWRNTESRLGPRVDTRADGGYIVAPPSVLAEGSYRWAPGMELDEPLDRLPEPPPRLVLELDRLGVTLATPFLFAAKSFADMGSELDDMNQRTGVSIEALSELGFAAKLSGTDAETLESGLRKMQKFLVEAASGSKEADMALDRLGLTFADLKKLNPEEQFLKIADKLGTIENPTLKAALALQLFGKSGTNLLPMLNGGAKGIEELRQKARDLGLTISTEDAKAAADFGDALDILQLVLKRAAFAVGSALAPTLQDFVGWVVRAVKNVTNWITRNKAFIVTAFKIAIAIGAVGAGLIAIGTAISLAGTALGALASVISGIGTILGGVATAITALLNPVTLVIVALVGLAAYFTFTSETGAQALAWLGDRFGELLKTATQAWQGIVDAVVAGDLELAAKIIWLTLKMEFQKGIAFLEELSPADISKLRRASDCEPYRAVIIAFLDQGLTAQRIHQELVAEHGFTGSYHSVRRFVGRLHAKTPLPFRRMECGPGEEAQVDFGTGAPIVTPDGHKRRSHVFRVVLSHSRKGYCEVVFRQTTDAFVRCLENAFIHFGGVPKRIVLDNLRAAVSKADWFDPDLNPKVRSFADHYGTVFLPTKPRMPRHKGKIERGIGYVKSNALKGRTFALLAEENQFLAEWERTVADVRIHGTTRKQVDQVFCSVERLSLLPLPIDRFPCFYEGQRIVSRDSHVEIARAYYSAPPEYLGRSVWARWDGRVVRLFNHRFEQIALHVHHEPGRFSTLSQHIVDEKITGVERGTAWILKRIQPIGVNAARWAEMVIHTRAIEGVRTLQGLLALAKRHPADRIDRCCDIALSHGANRLRVIRKLLARDEASHVRQTELPFMDEHPLIRPLGEYERFVHDSFQRGEST